MTLPAHDYHIHTSPGCFSETKNFLRELSIDRVSCVSLNNHESYDAYSSYPIIDYGKRVGIKIIPSFTIFCNIPYNGNEIIVEVCVLNPKKEAMKLLETTIIPEKINYITHIMYSLLDDGILIDPLDALKLIGTDDFQKLHLIGHNELSEVMVVDEYFESKKEANLLLASIDIKRLFPELHDTLKLLQGEECFIINPQEYPIDLIQDSIKRIKGLIMDFDSPEFTQFSELCYNNNIILKHGSGTSI